MNRIAFMVMRNFMKVPNWFYHIWSMGRPTDQHTEQERYNYLRGIVWKINQSGRVQVNVTGVEHIPEQDGFIMFPNHQGLFDVLAIIGTCPHPFGVVVKKEAAGVILVKQVVELLKGIAMDRADVRASIKVINQMTEEVKAGRNYVIFPEGTRSRDGNRILNFKSGTFKSAVNAQCPIVPVALINSFKPFDVNSIRREVVEVHYLNPIYPEQYAGLKTKEIAELVHDQIQSEIDKVTISKNI